MHVRDDKDLTQLLRPLANKHRYDHINASFKVTRDMSASWRIAANRVDLSLSDYLADAPDDAITEFVDSVIRMANGGNAIPMPTYMDWVSDDRFIINKRKIFINRSKNMKDEHKGDCRDIMDSLDRLIDSGLVRSSDIRNSWYVWTDKPNLRKVGYCSPLFRVVAISSALDSPDVPENVLDYVVFHETLHLRQGYRPFQKPHDRDFKRMESEYPDRNTCERFLRSMKINPPGSATVFPKDKYE